MTDFKSPAELEKMKYCSPQEEKEEEVVTPFKEAHPVAEEEQKSALPLKK